MHSEPATLYTCKWFPISYISSLVPSLLAHFLPCLSSLFPSLFQFQFSPLPHFLPWSPWSVSHFLPYFLPFLVSFFSLTTFFPICFPSFFPISWFPLFSSLFHFHRLPYCLFCFPPYLLRMFSPISVPMLVLCSSPFPSHFLPSDWVVSSSFFPFPIFFSRLLNLSCVLSRNLSYWLLTVRRWKYSHDLEGLSHFPNAFDGPKLGYVPHVPLTYHPLKIDALPLQSGCFEVSPVSPVSPIGWQAHLGWLLKRLGRWVHLSWDPKSDAGKTQTYWKRKMVQKFGQKMPFKWCIWHMTWPTKCNGSHQSKWGAKTLHNEKLRIAVYLPK